MDEMEDYTGITPEYDPSEYEPEYEPPRRPDRGRKAKPSPKKGELSLVFVQVVICLAALLFLFGIKALGGGIYKEFRQLYITHFNDKTSTDEIMKTISRALDLESEDNGSDKEKDSSSEAGSSEAPVSSDEESGEPSSDASSVMESGSAPASSGSSSSGASSAPEEEGDAAFTEDYGAISGHLAHDTTAINTMLTPVAGRITSPYGYRIHPITGVYSMHGGLDLGARMNTPISAAQSGTVLTVAYSSSYGNYIILQHSGGLQTLYAHCSSISAKVGEEIQRGQTIAKVGSTGVSTGPHLHFEVRINGTRINPQWVLKKIGQV